MLFRSLPPSPSTSPAPNQIPHRPDRRNKQKAIAVPKYGNDRTSKRIIFNGIGSEQISDRGQIPSRLADLSRCGGFQPTRQPPGGGPEATPKQSSAGVPLSAPPATRSPSPHPKNTKAPIVSRGYGQEKAQDAVLHTRPARLLQQRCQRDSGRIRLPSGAPLPVLLPLISNPNL